MPEGGPFLPLTGGTVTGMVGMTGARTWASGAFPGTNPALYQSVTYTGTATAGLPGPEGTSVPINLFLISENITGTGTAPGINGMEIQHSTTGGNGSRHGFLVAQQVTPGAAMGTLAPNYVGAQIFQTFSGNVTGAASGAGNGKGDTFGLGIQMMAASGSFLHGVTGFEIDINPAAGSSVDYLVGMQIVNFSSAGYLANVWDAMLSLCTTDPATAKRSTFGIVFGNPQCASNGFPMTATGTMISSFAGTCAVGIDFSANTFTTALLKGPNGFQIDGNNTISSGANTLTLSNSATPLASFKATASAPYGLFIRLDATAVTGGQNWTIGSTAGAAGEGQGLFIVENVALGAPAIAVDRFNVTRFPSQDVIVSGGTALATNITHGFLAIPAMAGTPTGTPDTHSTAMAHLVWDSTAKKLWIYDNVTSTWKGAVHT